MKATEAKLLDFLKKSPQFVIPIYQRTYSWTEKECQQLWTDLLRAGTDESIVVHFVGSIVYVAAGLSQVSHQSELLVIDGQQRLTTVSLLIAALARTIEAGESTEPVEGFSPRKLRNYYLLNPEEEGLRHFKLVLSQADKDTLMNLVGDHPAPTDPSRRVSENYAFFERMLKDLPDVAPICRGLSKLVVVDIALTRDQDNPQLIFESMNSTGRELSQADLVRNFVLMGLEPKLQTRLYENYWRPMEVAFGQEAYDTHFDGFMRHYLTVKTGEIPNVRQVYEAFKSYAQTSPVASAGVEALVKELRTFADHYCRMALDREPDRDLQLAFQDLRELKVDVAYPFLLQLYDDFRRGVLSREEMLGLVRLVESYVFRRSVCAIPTNSLNKTFAAMARVGRPGAYVESVQAHLLLLSSYRRFPLDDEFERELKVRDLYRIRSRSYWLRRLENHGRKERVAVSEYTVEHILPQNENLSIEWQRALGPDWKAVQERWLHTLGNLTLTGYNSEYSDHPFPKKRDLEGGFKNSPIRLNEGLGTLDEWNEQAIVARAERLAAVAKRVWSAPRLPEETLDRYRQAKAAPATYTIEHFPMLVNGAMAPIYRALRKEVLALDPNVTEEFLKLYVAFKAETNFLDVIPRGSHLTLVLNMPFVELEDPRKMARDITHIGQWGNGDVDLKLTSLDQIPYVIGLVRQSLEQQMGD
jgi:uncharacterized protein with ParB-like and HNH nuclease domain/predicted transport protein